LHQSTSTQSWLADELTTKCVGGGAIMAREADWYFDYLSPYPYLQMSRFRELPDDLIIRPRPVLFAALLNHWGHKGPAEIPKKKRQTYFYTRWLAEQRWLDFIGPPRHPFNPLALLRLTVAAGSTLDVVKTIYAHVWGEGADAESAESLETIGTKLGISSVSAVLTDPTIKDAVRANTSEAISLGVFGVPTFACAGELFWGDDATPLFAAFLADSEMFKRGPYVRIERVVASAERTMRKDEPKS
jgi:2-hydroxychromene-2-carboxylate isomerase